MIRILKKISNSFTDLTSVLKEYKTGTAVLNVATNTDYVYIGQMFPFNHLYFKLGTIVNDVVSTMKIEYWSSNQWKEVAEIIDDTNVSGAPLAQPGFITWVPNKNDNWNHDDTVRGDGSVEQITGMGAVKIYDQFWIRVSFSAGLKATTQLNWVGNLFSNDSDLFAEHSQLNKSSYLTSIEAGKTTYEEQAVIAAKVVIDDLSVNDSILHQGQILERDDFRLVSVSKTAEIVYGLLGRDYDTYAEKANKNYLARMKKKNKTIDTQLNARIDQQEVFFQPSLVRR